KQCALKEFCKAGLVSDGEDCGTMTVALPAFLRIDGAFAKLREGLLWPRTVSWLGRDGFAKHRSADRGVRERIDQNEAAGGAIAFVRIKEERAARREFDAGDFIHFEFSGWMLGQIVEVEARADGRRHGPEQAAGVLEQIVAIELEWLCVKPNDHSGEVGRGERRRVG